MTTGDSAPQGIDPKEWEMWDAKSKQRLLAALEAVEKKRKVWYCKRGRTCDGQPHDNYDYRHARGDQWPPEGESWLVWLLKGGRGSGKTRSGAEWIRKMATSLERTSIIGPTVGHVRDTMVEGESGLLAVFDNAKISALWEPSKRRITIPCNCKKPHRNGHIISAFTGDEPERLRGPQHAAVWLDEPAHMALIEAVWDNMMFGLRLGKRPVVLCSTTPLPTKWMKTLVAEPDTVSVTVSTYANMDNLAPSFRKVMLDKYEGTRMGRQELHGEILEDVVGALWTWAMIEDHRLRVHEDEDGNSYTDITAEDMERIIVAIDPAGTSSKKRDETGIVVVGKRGDKFYVLADYSGTYTPEGWARKAWQAFDEFKADKVIAEKNYGGEMVLSTLRGARKNGPVDLVHSRRGKVLRAEPIVSLYEQGRVVHMSVFEALETQMTEWVPDMHDSPDRVDALVHGITMLDDGRGDGSIAIPSGRFDRTPPQSSAVYSASNSMYSPLVDLGGTKPGLFGYQPRVSDDMFKPRDMPHCEHPTAFEKFDGTGLLCHTCLHEVEWEGNSLFKVEQPRLILPV